MACFTGHLNVSLCLGPPVFLTCLVNRVCSSTISTWKASTHNNGYSLPSLSIFSWRNAYLTHPLSHSSPLSIMPLTPVIVSLALMPRYFGLNLSSTIFTYLLLKSSFCLGH